MCVCVCVGGGWGGGSSPTKYFTTNVVKGGRGGERNKQKNMMDKATMLQPRFGLDYV